MRQWLVYPRVGGETLPWPHGTHRPSGLSPRGRGNPLHQHDLQITQRSIPAWAGKPGRSEDSAMPCAVYPRVGGETETHRHDIHLIQGLSPRGRGNRNPSTRYTPHTRSIPAWAGKPRRETSGRSGRQVYPRVGGETSHWASSSPPWSGLSPRGRGNHPARPRGLRQIRSIPAWAGKPDAEAARAAHRGVYPRVGGETPSNSSQPTLGTGLSPRGRGNPSP